MRHLIDVDARSALKILRSTDTFHTHTNFELTTSTHTRTYNRISKQK